MPDEDELEPQPHEPWFAGKPVDVLFYRINRRPIGGDPTLFDPPTNLLHHLQQVLDTHEPYISGRRFQRVWRLGNLDLDPVGGTFTAQLGWSRAGEAVTETWDDEEAEWVEHVVSREDSAVAPIAFKTDGRVLAILRHPNFSTESVLSSVVTGILNRGELAQSFPTTAWAVESLGSTETFLTWLESVSQLNRISLVFERPNPDGEKEFQQLFERLDALKADHIREDIVARDEHGLDKRAVLQDPTTRSFIAAAMVAFGRVLAKGKRRGKKTTYDQRAQVLRTPLDDVGPSMETATKTVLQAVERQSTDRLGARTRDRLQDGSASK